MKKFITVDGVSINKAQVSKHKSADAFVENAPATLFAKAENRKAKLVEVWNAVEATKTFAEVKPEKPAEAVKQQLPKAAPGSR